MPKFHSQTYHVSVAYHRRTNTDISAFKNGGDGEREYNGGNKNQFSRITSYLEIDVAIFVHVECTEHVVAEFLRIARREEHFVHVDEFRWR